MSCGLRRSLLLSSSTWTDFIVDRTLCSYQACYLSRAMVVVATPLASGFLGFMADVVRSPLAARRIPHSS